MLSEVLVFLRNQLNHQLNPRAGWTSGESQEETVVFIDGEKMDPIIFKLGAVTVLLINAEEDSLLRSADPYLGISETGTQQKVNPVIRLNLYVLFVARFKQYELGLSYLSDIIQYFQGNRIFDSSNSPDLSDRIEKLVLELVTLPFSEQNEVWNALRTTYHPSVLYKVRTIGFADQDSRRAAEITEKTFKVTQ